MYNRQGYTGGQYADRANAARKQRYNGPAGICFRVLFTRIGNAAGNKKEKMMENEMDGALKRGEFIVCLQPKMALKSNRIVGAEALVRWEKGKQYDHAG